MGCDECKGWVFQRVAIKNGLAINIGEVDSLTESRCCKALSSAMTSHVPTPLSSGYEVRGGINAPWTGKGIGGNIEFGHGDAVHAEVATISAYLSSINQPADENPPGDGSLILALVAGRPSEIIAPCGACRDFLLDTVGFNLEIVCASPEGGSASIINFREFLFEDYERIKLEVLSDTYGNSVEFPSLATVESDIHQCIRKCDRMAWDPYPMDIRHDRRYHASILCGPRSYYGARDLKAYYHPIGALQDACREIARSADLDKDIWRVMIVGEGDGQSPPQVTYEDRHCLIETLSRHQLLTGKVINPAVWLVTHDLGKLTGFWRTTARQWIPLAFDMFNLGEDFIQAAKKTCKVHP